MIYLRKARAKWAGLIVGTVTESKRKFCSQILPTTVPKHRQSPKIPRTTTANCQFTITGCRSGATEIEGI